MTENAMKIKKWEKRRKETFLSYLLQMFSVGFEFTMLQSTVLHYITTDMKEPKVNLYYGLISGGRLVSCILLTIPISKRFDKTRDLRFSAFVSNLLVAIGYALYIIPVSPLFPFFGTVLQGSNFVLNALMNSEVSRVYKHDEIQGKILLVVLAYGMGETLGPACVYGLQNVDLYMGVLRITYGNAPALVLFVFALIKLALGYFFIHDVSRQQSDIQKDDQCDTNVPDSTPGKFVNYLKRTKGTFFIHSLSNQEQDNEGNDHSNRDISTISVSSSRSYLEKAKQVFGLDGMLVLVQTFWAGSLISLVCRLPPLMMASLKMNDLILDICYMGISVTTIIVSLIIKKMQPSDVGVYHCGVASLVGILASFTIISMLNRNLGSEVANFILLGVFVLCLAVTWVTDQTYTIVAIGKLCQPERKSFAEGTRMVVKQCGSLVGSFTSAFLYEHFVWFFVCLVVGTCGLLICVVLRRRHIQEPKPFKSEEDTASILKEETRTSV